MNDFWTDYWRQGHLTSFGDSQGDGYQGKLASFWQHAFVNALQPGYTLVDIGCGNGAMFEILLNIPIAEQVTMIGVDAAALTIPEKFKLPNIYFHQQTLAESLPFDSDSVALVTSQFGLEYSDLSVSVKEIARVLKQHGKLISIMHKSDSSIVAPNKAIFDMARRLAEPETGMFASLKRYVTALRDNENVERHRSTFQSAFSQASEDNRDALEATNFPQFCQVLFDPQRDYENRQIVLRMFEDELLGQIERLSDLINAALDCRAQQKLEAILANNGFIDIQFEPFIDDDGSLLGIKVEAHVS